MKKSTMPLVGTGDIGQEELDAGYACTIYSRVETTDPQDVIYQNIHVSRMQAIELRNRLAAWLMDSEAHEKFLENMKTAPQVDYTEMEDNL